MSPKARTSVSARARMFLDKSREDKVRAINATVRHGLYRAGFRQSKARFRRLIAGEMETTIRRLHTLAVIERER